MTGFASLPDGIRCLFFVPLFILFTMELCMILSQFNHLRSMRHSLVFSIQLFCTAVIGSVLLSILLLSGEPSAFLRFLSDLPWLLWAVLLAALSGWVISSGSRFLEKTMNTISAVSVKEGTDNLPIGLCFCTPDGKTLLVNRRMELLCQAVTGDGLLNASAFWDILTRLHSPSPAGAPVWAESDDGSTWVFTRSSIRVDGKELYQITAADETQLHQISDTLRAGNDELRQFNERLRQHSINVDQLTREEEILAAKVNIHDELGQALLSSKFYLTQSAPELGAELSPEKLVNMWESVVALLRKEAHPAAAFDPMRELTDAAASVGVNVMIFGEAPVYDRSAMSLIFAAARVCLTNAVRHAGASAMSIVFGRSGAAHLLTITNNGAAPAGTIKEGGGLSDLRRRVEDAGGTMSIFSQPEFKLTLSIPGTEDVIQ